MKRVVLSSLNRNINQAQTGFDIHCFYSPGFTIFFLHSLWSSIPGSEVVSFLFQIRFYCLIHPVNKNEHLEYIMLLEDPSLFFFVVCLFFLHYGVYVDLQQHQLISIRLS